MAEKSNKYCRLSDLKNESSVEHFFLSRLLSDLGFTDSQVKTKESIDSVSLSRGSKKVNYKPDYVILLQRRPRLVIDAKSPTEDISKWTGQCSSYCFEINKKSEYSVKYFMLSNGIKTSLYQWESDSPELTLDFEEFIDGNDRLAKLISLVGPKAKSWKSAESTRKSQKEKNVVSFKKSSIEEINAAFAWCHQKIYTKDNMSQSAAFMEFVKLMFLKLLSDKQVHEKHPTAASKKEYEIPSSDVRFSKGWIEGLEKTTGNPVADILFVQLKRDLEHQIVSGKKKRIFDDDESLALSPETIKTVVEKLESMDLYSIDSDLNGRLFETFLNATMRGKDLGQYFTPRSVVKLMIQVAGISAGSKAEEIPTVIDPCCGSGGFLIDALWNMWADVDKNTALTAQQKKKLRETIATEKIIGADVGREPTIARIARINMFLHGDGGSRIYQCDSLDRDLNPATETSPERKKEMEEYIALTKMSGGLADVILTNPPFSKKYESKHAPEEKILAEYRIAKDGFGATSEIKASVKSSVLFLERYHQLLKVGGRVVAIIDDSILGGGNYADIRGFLRELFIVEAVISLPGDAFQRSHARVKTSIVSLIKRAEKVDGDPVDEQPSVFMYYCTKVGVDDPARQRSLPVDKENRAKALEEVGRVSTLLKKFREGKGSPRYTVSKSRLVDRLDVKSCLPKPQRLVKDWGKKGIPYKKLHEFVSIFDDDSLADDDVIETAKIDENVCLLRIRYDGVAEKGEEIETGNSKYSTLYRVKANDIVISHINAVHGAIAVIDEETDGCVVSSEYSICRAKSGYDPYLIWTLLRSPESRADFLLLSSGMGRTRVQWENARDLVVPVPDSGVSTKGLRLLAEARKALAHAVELKRQAELMIYESIGVDNKESRELIEAFKPPR